METGFVTISGSKIYWEKAGSGDPIIFIHADALDTRQWDLQFEYFSKKFTVVRFDIRGFGKSEIPTEAPYSFSEDLFILMNALSIQKAHIVGLSLGAAIGIDFSLTHPEKVTSLVLADSGISGDGFNEKFIKNIKTIEELAKNDQIDSAKKDWSDLSIFNYSRRLPVVWEKVQKMVCDTSGYRWYGKNQPIDINPPAIERLSEIKSNTLVLVGEHDNDDFQRKANLLNKKISGNQLISIPNAGHLSNMDNPEIFNHTMESFYFECFDEKA